MTQEVVEGNGVDSLILLDMVSRFVWK